MLVFRSLSIGLLGACLMLLATKPVVELRVTAASEVAEAVVEPTRTAPTIIDVAPGITAAQVTGLIRLEPGEHVVTVDDATVASDFSAGMVLANLEVRAKRFIDLGVVGPMGDRRILILLH